MQALVNALAADLSAVVALLGVDDAMVRAVLNGWGPGKFDAELFLDGKATGGPQGSSATLIPPAFGLAGVNLHTWTGWGSVSHWNAFVAVIEMHGKGTFVDARLNNPVKFPIAANPANHFMISDSLLLKTTWLPQSFLPCIFISLPSRRRYRRQALSIKLLPGEVKYFLTSRQNAPPAMCRHSLPNRGGTCTHPPKSASTASRLTGHRTVVTGQLHSRASGHIRKVASITMAGLRPCWMS